MKLFLALAMLLFSFSFILAQDAQTPLVEKEFKYKDWTYKTIHENKDLNLREFVADKKLVLVVYFAPWCHNWAFEAPIVEKFYEKYKNQGFDVIGVSEYGLIDDVKANLKEKGVTFSVVSESQSKDDRQKTLHYEYRQKTGDTSKWGSPWNLFIAPENLIKKDDEVLLKKAFIGNGELIEIEAEKFIRQKLGLPAEESKATATNKEIEPCESDKKAKVKRQK